MKGFFFGIVLASLLVGGYFYSQGWHPFAQPNQGNLDSHAQHNHEAKGALYICPMHPQISSNQPNQTCPVCGMDLVLATEISKSSGEGENLPSGHAQVQIKRKQLIGLKMGVVKKEKVFRTVSAPARAAFDPDLYTAQAEYQQALEQIRRVRDSRLPSVKKNVQRMLDSSRIRLKVLGLSDEQIAAIKPNSSISNSLLTYKKGDNVWIYADVYEMDLGGIKKGQSVKITANYLEGKTLYGKVTSTDQIVNPETRTAKVRILIEKSPVAIRSESFVEVAIYVPLGEHLTVPVDALVDTGEEAYVFVKQDNDHLEPRVVVPKFRAGDKVAIGSGLKEGESIVVSGNFLVDSESRLKGVVQEMNDKP